MNVAYTEEGYTTVEDTDDIEFYRTPARFWCGVDGPYATEKVKRRKSVNNYVAAPVVRGSDGNLYFRCGGTHLIPEDERKFIQGDATINLSAMTREQEDEYAKYINYFIDLNWIEDYAKRTKQSELDAAREVWSYRKAIHQGHDYYNGIICGYDVVNGVKLPEPDEPFVVRF